MTLIPTRAFWLAALAATAITAPASAETTLRFNNFLPPTSFLFNDLLKPWAEEVSEATGGEVKIEFTTTTLGAPPTQLDMVSDGIADMAFSIAAWTGDRLKLTQLAELPFVGDSSEAISVSLWNTYEAHFAQANEFRGVKLLGFVTSVPSHLYTADGPITTVGDLSGLKLRVSGPVPGQIAEHLGAVPVGAPGSKAYEMMSSGVIDGTFFSHDGITDMNMEPLIKHVTLFPKGLFNTVFYIIVNEDAWNGLSPEVQDQIMSVSGEAMAHEMGAKYDAYAAQALDRIEAAGSTVTEASPELMQAVRDIAGPLEAAWIEVANGAGTDAQTALDDFKAGIAAGE